MKVNRIEINFEEKHLQSEQQATGDVAQEPTEKTDHNEEDSLQEVPLKTRKRNRIGRRKTQKVNDLQAGTEVIYEVRLKDSVAKAIRERLAKAQNSSLERMYLGHS